MSRRLVLAVSCLSVLIVGASAAHAVPRHPSSAFKVSEACLCHGDLITQWSNSMHAKALTDPLYKVKRDEADKATGGALGAFCDACHTPVGAMSGEAAKGPDKQTGPAAEGVVCDFCHQVTSSDEPIGNSSYVVTPNGLKRAQLKDAESYIHLSEYSALHTTGEFCGMCHDVRHPANNMHLEATYSEWKAGPYAKKGVMCQDCHMTPGPSVAKPNPGVAALRGPERDHIYTMTFVGANSGLGDASRAEANLMAAAKMDVSVPEIVAPGQKGTVRCTITNVGAGHHLPTGLTEVRMMWLEVKGIDASGKETSLGKREFHTVLKDAKGNHPVELWDAAGIHSDDRIPAGKSVTQSYDFTMPEGGPMKLVAALYYRSAPEEMAKKAGVTIPTVTMASSDKVIYGSAAQMEEGQRSAGWGLGAGIGGTEAVILGAGVAGLVGVIALMAWFVVRRRQA